MMDAVERLINYCTFFLIPVMDRKYISIQILEEDSYEKDVLFYVNLKEPRLADGELE
jgi:hypothetical protein